MAHSVDLFPIKTVLQRRPLDPACKITYLDDPRAYNACTRNLVSRKPPTLYIILSKKNIQANPQSARFSAVALPPKIRPQLFRRPDCSSSLCQLHLASLLYQLPWSPCHQERVKSIHNESMIKSPLQAIIRLGRPFSLDNVTFQASERWYLSQGQ